MLYIKENGNDLHITEFEKMDNRKEYDRMIKIMKDDFDSCWNIVNHIEKTTPIFGEWNIIKDRFEDFKGIGDYWKNAKKPPPVILHTNSSVEEVLKKEHRRKQAEHGLFYDAGGELQEYPTDDW